MRRISLLLLLACFVSVNARVPHKRPDEKNLNTPLLLNAKDSASFAFGFAVASDMVSNLGNFPAKVDRRLMLEGFTAVMRNDSTSWTADKAAAFVNDYFTKAQQEKNKKMQAEQTAWLENNAKRDGVVTLPSGLQYEVIKEGEGEKPTPNSLVKVHYEGKLIDGTVFDSSFERGEPIELRLNQVIKGWTEGLQLMKRGAEYILFVPYNLGYGERGAGQSIPPYSTLIFRVQLLEINE